MPVFLSWLSCSRILSIDLGHAPAIAQDSLVSNALVPTDLVTLGAEKQKLLCCGSGSLPSFLCNTEKNSHRAASWLLRKPRFLPPSIVLMGSCQTKRLQLGGEPAALLSFALLGLFTPPSRLLQVQNLPELSTESLDLEG